jgi:hypothetical protein
MSPAPLRAVLGGAGGPVAGAWPGPAKLVVEGTSYAGELRSLDAAVASYFVEILERWVAEYGGPVDPEGEKILWDVACVAAVADPEAVTLDRLAAPTLDAAGAHDFSRRGREVEALTDLDAGRVLARHPANPAGRRA